MKLDPEIYILATTLLFIGIGLIFDRWGKKHFWVASLFFFVGSFFSFQGLSIRGAPGKYFPVKGGYIGSTQAILLGTLICMLSIYALIMAPGREKRRFRKASKKDKPTKEIPYQNQPEETDFNDLYEDFEEKIKDRKEPDPNKPIRKIYYEL